VEELLLEKGVRTPISVQLSDIQEGKLYIQKPRFGGCHRGIEILDSHAALNKLQQGLEYDVLLQPYLVGREFSVGVIPKADASGYEVLPPVEIVPYPAREVFVAGSSYGSTQRDFEPMLDEGLFRELHTAAIMSHNTFGLHYMSRIDVREFEGHIYILDINTMPNMHPTKSLIPAILKQNGMDIKDLLDRFMKINLKMNRAAGVLESLNHLEEA
jgi:D-alanine-D-alanine ligase-like ATP-grasp enzyme